MSKKLILLTFFIVVLGLGLSIPAGAEEFLVEHFNYANGTDLAGQVAGQGGWVASGGNYMVLNDDGLGDGGTSSLQYAGLTDSQGGRLAQGLTTDGDCDYILSTPVVGEGNTLYLSVLLKPTVFATSYFMMFATSGSANGSLGRLTGRESVGQQELGIRLRTSNDNGWSGKTVALGETALVVIKLTMVPGPDNDTMELWVNPTVGTSEPPADVGPLGGNAGNDVNPERGIQGFRFRTSNSSGAKEVDEIRFGTTWADVVGSVAGEEAASAPSPGDEMTDVLRDVVLGWKPGKYAAPINGHKVYFSENFDDVNDGIGDITQDANSYAPGRLDFGTTYYWRVDEVNAPPDSTIFEGELWQFTTELLAYAIPGEKIIATASSSGLTKGPENTVNGSGLDDSGLLHGNVGDNNMWLSVATGPQPTWIQYEFDKVHKLHEMWVWNSNESLEPMVGLGFKDVSIEYSANGTDYTTLGTTHEFARAPGTPDYAHNTTVDFGGVAAKYVRLTANNNWGGFMNQYGLSEVRFFHVPVHARKPDPDSGTTDVSIGTIDEPIDVTLGWNAGREAAKHDVYFSDSKQAVIDGTADVISATETSYGPLSLDLGSTYYWRVDEVNEAETPTTWQGDLWDFTTQEYFVLEDFESYNDLDPADPNSNRIFLTWLDGYEQPTNGSLVGYPELPFAEQSIVHGGGQSMPLFYDNSGTANYSEATLTLSSGRDWTKKGIEALSLWFRGYPASFSTFTEEPPGTYTMTARSGNIADESDELHFVYKTLSGAGSIVAKVESVTNTSDSAKAGVMIRNTLDPSSTMALTFARPDGDVRFRRRVEVSGDDRTSSAGILGLPSWVKLDRDAAGNFRAFHSADGTTWVPVDVLGDNIQMNTVVYIGLALCSNNTDETCEAIFSSVSTTGTVTGQWQSQDIGILSNDPEPMYAAVANSGGTPAVVYHDYPNAALIDTWTQWNIDLTNFSNQGVVLTNVETISIGFGDKNPDTSGQPGGSGTMYFDDIGLYSSRCISSLRKPQGDINNDCAVNYLDLEIMAGDWLVSGPALESDLDNDEKVDFKDYALLADAWLDELLWP